MSFLVNWQSDGLGAVIGIVALSLLLLAASLWGARSCRPVAKILPLAIVWHFGIYLFTAFWLLPFYGEVADAFYYHNEGIQVASLIRHGMWSSIDWGASTKLMPILAGFLYAPFGADIYGGLFFSAVLGMAGGVYFCRAFSLFSSDVKTKRYSQIVLLMPSVAMWTSDFGKDSWVALGLGLASFGYAKIQKGGGGAGISAFLSGFALLALIRPHVALVIATSMAAAYIWALTKSTKGSAVMKIVRTVALVAIVFVLFRSTQDVLQLTDTSASTVDSYVRSNSEANAALGGSVVEVQAAPGVLGALMSLPRGFVRVLLQPFPWEIHNVNAALASLENLFIGWYLTTRLTKLRRMTSELVRVPYILFAGFAAVLLMVMFSFIPNLGLLSRQRVQLLPFLFALLVTAEGRRRAKPISFVLAPSMEPQPGHARNEQPSIRQPRPAAASVPRW